MQNNIYEISPFLADVCFRYYWWESVHPHKRQIVRSHSEHGNGLVWQKRKWSRSLMRQTFQRFLRNTGGKSTTDYLNYKTSPTVHHNRARNWIELAETDFVLAYNEEFWAKLSCVIQYLNRTIWLDSSKLKDREFSNEENLSSFNLSMWTYLMLQKKWASPAFWLQ